MSAAPLRLYGIANCDTVKAARAWLQAHGRDAAFHDFRRQGVPAERLAAWVAAAGWERVLNRRGTSWRRLDDATRAAVVDAASALLVMQAEPSTIKRPVVEWPDGAVTIGFDPDDWSRR